MQRFYDSTMLGMCSWSPVSESEKKERNIAGDVRERIAGGDAKIRILVV